MRNIVLKLTNAKRGLRKKLKKKLINNHHVNETIIII